LRLIFGDEHVKADNGERGRIAAVLTQIGGKRCKGRDVSLWRGKRQPSRIGIMKQRQITLSTSCARLSHTNSVNRAMVFPGAM
jgi:hypothetical protein